MTDHFFKRMTEQGSATQLAFVRIVFGLYVFWLLAVPGNLQIFEVLPVEPFEKVHFFMLPNVVSDLMIEHNMLVIRVGLIAAACMVVGLFTAISSWITAFCFIATHYTLFKFTYYHNEWPYLWLPLIVLAIARCGDKFSIDAWFKRRRSPMSFDPQSNAYRWPIEVIIAFFASIYFCAGVAKLIPLSSGIQWLKGIPIQWLVATRFFDSPAYWVTGQPLFDYTILWPFTILSVSAIIVELSAGLIWISRKYFPWCLGIIFSLHLGIYFLAGMPGFFQTYFIFCFVFIPAGVFSRFD
jgi:uncharacterized membrane protein YphA (DoxX/SURF4 family)